MTDLAARALELIRAHCTDRHALTRYDAVRDELRADTAQLRDALRQLEAAGLIEWRSNGAIRPVPASCSSCGSDIPPGLVLCDRCAARGLLR